MNCISNINNGLATENLVFLNKIFYDNTGTSCPVIYDLATTTTDFTQQLIISSSANNCGCGGNSRCGCNTSTCDFDLCNAQFTVTNSCVTVTSTTLAAAATFTAADVTVDGFPVTALTTENGRYTADLSGIMAELENCPCGGGSSHICRDNCTCSACKITNCSDCVTQCDNNGHFFLAEVPGPWEVLFTIVLEGYVTNGRCTRDFKLCIKTTNPAGTPVPVEITAANNFALYCVDIPCQSQGVAPLLRFNFESCAMLLNPVLTIVTPTPDPDAVCPPPTELTLTASMIFTPKINLQVVRPTLFALNANEVGTCCDNLDQCDSCAPYMNDGCGCDDRRGNGCGCGDNDGCGCNDNAGCGCSSAFPELPACQCCNTNGYRF